MVTPPKSPRPPTSPCPFSLLLPTGTTSPRFFYHCEIQVETGHPSVGRVQVPCATAGMPSRALKLPFMSLFKKSLGVIVWIPKLAMAEMVRQGRRPGWLQRGWRDSRRLSSRLARGGDGRGERGLSTSFPCWIAAQPPGGAGVGGEAKEGRVVDAQSWRWRRSAVMTRRPCQT